MPISLQQLKDAGNTPSDREWGTPSLTQTYLRDTPHARIDSIRHAFACATLDGKPCNCGVANVQPLREWPNLFRKTPTTIPSFTNWMNAQQVSDYVRKTYGTDYSAASTPTYKQIIRRRDGRMTEVRGVTWKEAIDKAQATFHWIRQVVEGEKPLVESRRFIKFLNEASQPARRLGVALNGESEYWAIGDTVFRAAIGAPIDGDGHPCGKKWMCSIQHWERYRDAFEPIKT